jgi:hypothetical protein
VDEKVEEVRPDEKIQEKVVEGEKDDTSEGETDKKPSSDPQTFENDEVSIKVEPVRGTLLAQV